MRTVEIPGGTATLRERSELRVRDKEILEAAAIAAAPALRKLPVNEPEKMEGMRLVDFPQLTFEEAQTLNLLQRSTIVAYLAGWSLPEPLPTMDSILDMPASLYEALGEATRREGAEVVSNVDFSPSDPRSPGFDQTPTPPSAGSDDGSRGSVSPSTGTPNDVTESSVTVASSV